MTKVEAYDPKEIREVIEWLDARRAQLPKEIDLNKGEHCSDVAGMIDTCKAIAENQSTNPRFKCNLSYLFLLREKLRESGAVTG